MLDEFKKFILRGNVIDLAVAVVIGAAFKTVVDSIVNNLINPLLGLIGNKDFSQFVITLRDPSADGTDPGVVLRYGAVLTDALSFVLIAAAIFFLIVRPLNVLAERRARGQVSADEEPPPSDEVVLLGEIRDLLRTRA